MSSFLLLITMSQSHSIIIKNRFFLFFPLPLVHSHFSDAKDISNTQSASEILMNPTETFDDNTGMNAIHSNDDNELSGDEAQTSTHIPMPMTLQTTISAGASATTNTMTPIIEQASNRLFVATDGMAQHHFTVPNESIVTSHSSSTINVSVSYSQLSNINNSNSMTLSHDNNRNSSNISFNSIKFTTMKPCKSSLSLLSASSGIIN